MIRGGNHLKSCEIEKDGQTGDGKFDAQSSSLRDEKIVDHDHPSWGGGVILILFF